MENIKSTKKYLFISVKPEFARKIVEREKSIELRKIRPHVKMGDYVIIYASSPIKCVIGFGIIKNVIVTSPQDMWLKYAAFLGIDKIRFDDYYQNRSKAIGIEIEAIKHITPISLESLRAIDPTFHPPQIYRYVTNQQICETMAQFFYSK